MTFPTTIMVATSPTAASGSHTQTPQGLPTGLPVAISPNAGVPEAPVGSELIQIAFSYPLNYPFVLKNPVSQAQIFEWLPTGISYGLNIPNDTVIMQQLKSYDTSDSLDYVTTLAMVYIPKNFVDSLQLALRTGVSKVYNTNDPSVNTLMSYINTQIGITVGSTLTQSSGTGSGSSSPAASSASSGNGGVFNTETQNTSTGTKGTTAGIVVGVAGAAAAYGAGMFFIARRYKRRKALHRRSSSMPNPSEMRQAASGLTGGAFMSGGRLSDTDTSQGYSSSGRNSHGSGQTGRTGQSARTAQISAPMMAENSLGWN